MNPGRFTKNDYMQLRDFLSREFGLYFEPDKLTFLENRIIPMFEAMKCMDMNHFINLISENPQQRTRLLDVITTNETWFFRHPRHFDILREYVLPKIIKSRKVDSDFKLKIWSAGCSIGAELFSIAITLSELIPDMSKWNIRLYGSDISSVAVEHAKCGVYNASELKLLSNVLLAKYFIPAHEKHYKIKSELRNLVEFERLNLLDRWPERSFDVIFCRNTMIYFHEMTKTALTERFYKALLPEGVFFTSSTETLHSPEGGDFERIFIQGEYIYRKKVGAKSYYKYSFDTPSDLLRALNLLARSNIEYQLVPIDQKHHLSPKKALFINEALNEKVDGIFKDSALASFVREKIEK